LTISALVSSAGGAKTVTWEAVEYFKAWLIALR